MKLSVVMSSYNNEDFISQAVESILNQSFHDFEFIIVDDGSSDDTNRIIRDYCKNDKRIILIEQDNKGLTKSLNIAIGIAKGEYIARQDADDISVFHRLERQVEFLDQNKGIGFIGSSIELMNEDGSFLNLIKIRHNPKKNITLLKKQNIFCHGSMMFRKALLNKIGGYREYFKYAQDYDLYLRLIEYTTPGAIEGILYKRRIGIWGISITKLRLQSTYAGLAKTCFNTRMKRLDDSYLLRDTYLVKSNCTTYYDFISIFMKSLYSLKKGDVRSAREIIKPYMFPFNKDKQRLYFLWFFSYFPSFLREAIFNFKMKMRKIAILEND